MANNPSRDMDLRSYPSKMIYITSSQRRMYDVYVYMYSALAFGPWAKWATMTKEGVIIENPVFSHSFVLKALRSLIKMSYTTLQYGILA